MRACVCVCEGEEILRHSLDDNGEVDTVWCEVEAHSHEQLDFLVPDAAQSLHLAHEVLILALRARPPRMHGYGAVPICSATETIICEFC